MALGAATALVALGAVVTVVVVVGDDDPATAPSLSQVEASCGDWMASASGDERIDARPDDEWCADMFAWMADRSEGSMMSTMMWQGPDQMGRACRAWVSDERGESGPMGPQQCDAMLGWMAGHLPREGGRWMMHDR